MSEIANKLKVIALAVIFTAGLTLILTSVMTSANVQAQDDELTLRRLFEQFDSQLEQSPDLAVYIQFVEPIYEGATSVVLGSSTDGTPRIISEVGQDYLCIIEGAGGSDVTRCIPYSNIASVSYIDR